jgi:hypothetical protein
MSALHLEEPALTDLAAKRIDEDHYSKNKLTTLPIRRVIDAQIRTVLASLPVPRASKKIPARQKCSYALTFNGLIAHLQQCQRTKAFCNPTSPFTLCALARQQCPVCSDPPVKPVAFPNSGVTPLR